VKRVLTTLLAMNQLFALTLMMRSYGGLLLLLIDHGVSAEIVSIRRLCNGATRQKR
jgi:hypothetical protein